MKKARPCRIAIVNRFAPPDGAPTATAAASLALELAAVLPHAEITLHASRASYGPSWTTDAAPNIPTRRVPSLYSGKWQPARLAASLFEGWLLARQASRAADIVISLTDPPLLSFWIGPACRRHGRRWIEWTLDRYPDFFPATGLASEENLLYRQLSQRDAELQPDAVIGLGVGQLNHLATRRRSLPPALIVPVGLVPPVSPAPPPDTNSRLTLVYAGTLGEAHDPAALTALIARADPARFHFALAVSGQHAAGLRRRLSGHPAVSWHDHLSNTDLAAAAAHIVTLSSRATHLSVPSKAVTAVCLGRPFLFCGAPEADTWRDLGAAGWLIPQTTPDAVEAAIDEALSALANPETRQARAATARALAVTLHRARSDAVANLAAMITA